jgi:hypothetical protein
MFMRRLILQLLLKSVIKRSGNICVGALSFSCLRWALISCLHWASSQSRTISPTQGSGPHGILLRETTSWAPTVARGATA